MSVIPLFAAWVLPLIVVSHTLRAATIVSNFPAGSQSELTNSLGARNAQGFVTPGTSVDLDSVTLILSGFGGGSGFSLKLFSDTGGGVPSSTLLATFTSPGPIGNTPASYTLLPVGEITLVPNSVFWLQITSSDSVFWYESSTAPAGLGFLTPGYRNTDNQWFQTDSRFAVQIEGTLVPEPSCKLLFLSATGLLGGLIRGQRTPFNLSRTNTKLFGTEEGNGPPDKSA